MTLDLAKLKEAAEKATEGPWFAHDFTDAAINSAPTTRDVTVSCTTPDHITVAEMGGGLDGHTGLEQARKDATYIALANPATILALIERLESAEEIVRAFTGDPHIGHIQAARAHMEKHLAKP